MKDDKEKDIQDKPETPTIKIYEVEKNPEIDLLEEGSISKKLYDELYLQFYEAQIPKSPDFPYGIEKGDQTDIRLMNSAYGFAKSVGDSIIVGAEGGEIDITNFLKKSGDSMTGTLRAIRGLEAGEDGRVLLSTAVDEDGIGYINIGNYITIPEKGLFVGGKNIFYRDSEDSATVISDENVTVNADKLKLPLNTDVGGFVFSENGIEGNGIKFWHSKNSNLPDIDWQGKDIVASNKLYGKKLHVKEDSLFNGDINVVIKDSNKLKVREDYIAINNPLYLQNRMYVDDIRSIRRYTDGVIYEASGAEMTLGSEGTELIKLASELKTWNGDSTIISPAGYGNFTMGFQASHNKSNPIIKTYKKEIGESGVIIDDTIRFLNEKGVYLSYDKDKYGVEIGVKNGKLVFYSDLSTSLHKPANRESYSVFVDTDTDFIVFKQPLEAESFTIDGKQTRLEDQLLKINNGHMIEGTEKYMAYYGNMVIKNDMTTDNFSTGFAGSGWGIRNNPVTGITGITIDEAIIRRKMRVYELEVQKITATNGSLWVSDSMSGDTVTQII